MTFIGPALPASTLPVDHNLIRTPFGSSSVNGNHISFYTGKICGDGSRMSTAAITR
jgi:hypothetical protein